MQQDFRTEPPKKLNVAKAKNVILYFFSWESVTYVYRVPYRRKKVNNDDVSLDSSYRSKEKRKIGNYTA